MDYHLLFLPQQNRVACAVRIVAQIMIERQLRYLPSIEQCNGLFWPKCPHPTFWSGAFVIQKNFHAYPFVCAL